MIQKENNNILIIGATMTALGAALEKPDKVTVIEAGAAPAPEFAGAFYAGEGNCGKSYVSERCCELERELTERNVLTSGRFHIPALIPVLSQRIKDADLLCLFWTDIVDISRSENDEGYIATFFNASGLQNQLFNRVIDTTSAPSGWEAPRRWSEKRLWAQLHGKVPPGVEMNQQGIHFRPGRFDTECYFGVELAPETEMPAARRKLINAWRSRPPTLADTRIAALATEFQYCCSAEAFEPEPGLTHLPSAGFSDPLDAFDAGYRLITQTERETL